MKAYHLVYHWGTRVEGYCRDTYFETTLPPNTRAWIEAARRHCAEIEWKKEDTHDRRGKPMEETYPRLVSIIQWTELQAEQ